MDEMRVTSKFTTGLISRVLRVFLKRKTGYEADIRLNEIRVTVSEGKARIHLDADAEIEQGVLMNILKDTGLS